MPYVVLAMVNFVLLFLLAVVVFRVPVTGNLLALTLAAFLYVLAATALGLLFSTFMRSQIAALFSTMLGTILPATQFSGFITPVSSLEGAGRVIGSVYPAGPFITVSRGVFSKALGFSDLMGPLLTLAAAFPVLLLLCVLLTKKQER